MEEDDGSPFWHEARLALEKGITVGGDGRAPRFSARFHELVARHMEAGGTAADGVMAAIREMMPGPDVAGRAMILVYVVYTLERTSPEFAREVTDGANRGDDQFAELYRDRPGSTYRAGEPP